MPSSTTGPAPGSSRLPVPTARRTSRRSFVRDGDDLVFTTGGGTVKGKALARDPRVAICVDDENPPFAFVIVEGVAEVSHDLDEMLAWATRLGGRYMGANVAADFGRRNAVPTELLVRVRPTRVIAKDGISD